MPYKIVASTVARAHAKKHMYVGGDMAKCLGFERCEIKSIISQAEKEIVIQTERGLGVISPIFYISSGLYTYVHINSRAASEGRVMNYLSENGICAVMGKCDADMLRDEDIPTYRAIESVLKSFDSIADYTAGDYMRSADGEDRGFEQSFYELEELLQQLADFCGVSVEARKATDSDSYATARDMRTFISTVLICLAIAKAHAEGNVSVSVGAKDGVWTVETDFIYRDKQPINPDALRYLELTADVTGMKFMCDVQPAPKIAGKRGNFSNARLTVVFTSNPDIGVAWDVKAKQVIKY
jgi:hypothetical protein